MHDFPFDQIIPTARSVQEADAKHEDFEGWVHCIGNPNQFVQAKDVELRQAARSAGISAPEASIIVCRKCVVQTWENETEKKWGGENTHEK